MQRQYHESSREITGSYWAAQGTSHIKPRGPLGSSPLRSDGSRNGQAGEAGLVEQCLAEAKSLKTKGQGTVRLSPSGQQPRQSGGGREGWIKNYSHDKLTQRNKQWAKSNGQRKALHLREKRKDAYSMLQSWIAGVMSSSMRVYMNENQNSWSQFRATAWRGLISSLGNEG